MLFSLIYSHSFSYRVADRAVRAFSHPLTRTKTLVAHCFCTSPSLTRRVMSLTYAIITDA
jgi:hypothetical protein